MQSSPESEIQKEALGKFFRTVNRYDNFDEKKKQAEF